MRINFDNLVQGLFADPATRTWATRTCNEALTPPLDLTETTDHYKAVVDVPGFTMEQINVQLADNVLTLAGDQPEAACETAEGKAAEECRCHIAERTRGSFSRSIKFPVPVDAAGVKAALKNGVLTITVPKAASAKTQKITITEA
jgi:HSP20 family protein